MSLDFFMSTNVPAAQSDNCEGCHRAKSQLVENGSGCYRYGCYTCGFLKYRSYCPCCGIALESENLKDFAAGTVITCTSAKCGTKFQVIRCPHPDCQQFNCYTKCNYKMGELVKCAACKTAFQQVTCPECFELNYYRGDAASRYTAGTLATCYACNGKFQQLTCPHCNYAKYFKSCEYISGSIQSCESCGNSYQHTVCLDCMVPSYYPNCDFKYRSQQTCLNQLCKKKFEVVICPCCKKDNIRRLATDSATNCLFEYSCWNCNQAFSQLSCFGCQELVNLTQNGLREGTQDIHCQKCTLLISQLYCCKRCNTAYPGSSTCPSCPPVQEIPQPPVSNTQAERPLHANSSQIEETKEDRNRAIEVETEVQNRPREVEEKYDNCVICMDAKAACAFIPCGHKKTCKECTMKILLDLPSKRQCPICRCKANYALQIYE